MFCSLTQLCCLPALDYIILSSLSNCVCLLLAVQDCLEDLTGKGLQDLQAGLIRTPLPPQETFMDGVCEASWHSFHSRDVSAA